MRVTERAAGDVDELELRAGAERDAAQRDRYRAVLMAIDGHEAAEIADALGRSRRGVQGWVYAYRDGGVDALRPRPRPGRPTKLPRDREGELRARLDAGPRPADGVCTLRGRDVVRILAAEFGVAYTLDGAYDLLERLGYSCLRPRPSHEKSDPVAPRGGTVRVWFMDEAGFGQQGTVTDVWAKRGSRPRAVRQTRYEWVYLYAAASHNPWLNGAASAHRRNRSNRSGWRRTFQKFISHPLRSLTTSEWPSGSLANRTARPPAYGST
jgi:transposase